MLENSHKIDGSFSNGDISRLAGLASNVPDGGLIIELGCLYGKSSSVIYYSKSPSVRFFTSDIFIGTERWPAEKQYEKLIHNMCQFKFYPQLLFGTSSQVVKLFEDRSVDLVFIDANHEFEFVRNDIAAFMPKMKAGGVISGHDWCMESVRLAVREAFGTERVCTVAGTSVWSVKIGEQV